MSEEWAPLDPQGFSRYSISSWGRVLNKESNRHIALTKNQQGFVKVSLVQDDTNERLTMQVNRLVAREFVLGETEAFDSIIHLNGNREHTFADNLAWRPRWFSLLYHAQYAGRKAFVPEPVVNVDTDEVFEDSRHAAMRYGLLEKDIFLSTCNHTRVFPIGHTFQIMDKE